MKHTGFFPFLASAMMACGPSGTVTEDRDKPSQVRDPAEVLYASGHSHYIEARYDSACYYLEQVRALRPVNTGILRELGESYYAVAVNSAEGTAAHDRAMRLSLERYASIDSLGKADENTYERLTDLSYRLGDNRLFLHYAEKQAVQHPGDRELYNLGLAYFEAGSFQKTIDSQKEAIRKYPLSPHVGGFYRLLGDGYLSIDRQQTAEKTYEEGVQIVDKRVRESKETDSEYSSTPEYRQLVDSRHAMLLSLKKLYRLHGKKDRLDQVERQLEKDP